MLGTKEDVMELENNIDEYIFFQFQSAYQDLLTELRSKYGEKAHDVLMEYFVGQEDYEKAAELRDQKLLNSYYSFPAPPVACNNEKTSSHLDENL